MSKKVALILAGIVVLITIVLFIFIEIPNFQININNEQTQDVIELDDLDRTKYIKDFGSYEVPNTWAENKEHSTLRKFFYIAKDEENMNTPDNISVNEGSNKYLASEHEKFREAILNQLNYQIAGLDATINANGSNTENGYIVYEFNIEEDDVITTQYYIVGDYKYVLVHETVFEDKESTDEVAKMIVNTFKWNE